MTPKIPGMYLIMDFPMISSWLDGTQQSVFDNLLIGKINISTSNPLNKHI